MTKKEFDKARNQEIAAMGAALCDGDILLGSVGFCAFGGCDGCLYSKYKMRTLCHGGYAKTPKTKIPILMAVLLWLLSPDFTYETIVKSTRRIKPDGE